LKNKQDELRDVVINRIRLKYVKYNVVTVLSYTKKW